MSNIAISERRNWLGASEVAALFGLSPYLTEFELWHIKRGNIPSANLDDVERVQAGQHLEPAIAAWASSRWDWPVEKVQEYLVNQRVERMGASLDFRTPDGEPVEIKNVDNLVFRDGDYQHEGDILLDAPAHFLIQVQHQIACLPSRVERGWLVVCVGGNRLYRMEIPRHDRMISQIERKVEAFWQSVESGREPHPDFQSDSATIAMLYGGEGDEIIDLRDNERVRQLCVEYMEAHEIEKEGRNRKSAAMAEIKTLLDDARGALVGDGFKVKASFVKGGTYERADSWRFNITKKKEI